MYLAEELVSCTVISGNKGVGKLRLIGLVELGSASRVFLVLGSHIHHLQKSTKIHATTSTYAIIEGRVRFRRPLKP